MAARRASERRAAHMAWRLSAALGLLSGAGACVVPSPSNPNHVLEGVDMQYKLLRFFDGKGPPPLEEVFFTTQNLTRDVQDELMKDCPGLLINSFIVLAEVRLPVAPGESASAIAKAEHLAEQLSKEDYDAAVEAWPLLPALASYRRAAEAAEAAPREAPSVDLVVCHCGESLDWLSDGSAFLPAPGRAALDLHVYEKCSKPADLSALSAPFRSVHSVPVSDGNVRRDECSAYLRHLVDHYSDPADYTFFFQADAGDHMQWGYLSLVMRAIDRHTLQAPFVHLNHPRLVASLSPCREEVFRQVFGRGPGKMLGSYCCAQFAVARERVLANPLERYERMLQMLYEASPEECHDIPGHSTHCLMYEVYWHVLFGEPDDLPERAANTALPLFLRIRDIENESYLPPGSLYLQHIQEA